MDINSHIEKDPSQDGCSVNFSFLGSLCKNQCERMYIKLVYSNLKRNR
jgi:hypothetical protein